MLAEAAIWVAAVTTVISASGFALEDVGPELHGKKKGQDILACHFLAPRDRLELPTKWLTATRSTN